MPWLIPFCPVCRETQLDVCRLWRRQGERFVVEEVDGEWFLCIQVDDEEAAEVLGTPAWVHWYRSRV